ncbi:MAG TPA: MBL fold metallo-hydrolase [Flavobacteriales bacterium]|nr:MBL fold metallo-hydrolase [Flavobacteriales bacterium]
MKKLLLPLVLLSCGRDENVIEQSTMNEPVAVHAKNPDGIYIVVLGTVQDGGSPHLGCSKTCCKKLFEHPDPLRKVVSLAVVDSKQHKSWLIEATPDLPEQVANLNRYAGGDFPESIFLTHAHIGHYTGLMYLGKEAKNTKQQKVYAMPRMKEFLEKNGPWSQLVTDSNILIKNINVQESYSVSADLQLSPFPVQHRDEFSETVGYTIKGPHKTAVFIPDIDKWSTWHKDIKEVVTQVDFVLIDGTFFDGSELPGRDMKKIPHPLVVESMELFKDLPAADKKKIYFIHLNHTNPLLNPESPETKKVQEKGFNIARMNMVLEL